MFNQCSRIVMESINVVIDDQITDKCICHDDDIPFSKKNICYGNDYSLGSIT